MAEARQLICDVLVEAGVDTVFGLPGGATQFLFDSLYDYRDRITVVPLRQENAVTCAADGYARASGKLGVAMGQGPFMGSYGAIGVMEAYMSSSPILVITDNSDWNGFGQKGSLQCSSGEYGALDLRGVFKGISKYVSYATNGSELVFAVEQAIRHAQAGRPGPAVVIGKWQAFQQDIDPSVSPRLLIHNGHMEAYRPAAPIDLVERAATMLSEATRPVIIAGNGVKASAAYEALLGLAHTIPAPIATSYKGKSAVAETDPLALGTLGFIGQRTANLYVSSADVVLVVGSRLSPQDVLYENPDLLDPIRQTIIQIDIEPRNIGWTIPVHLGLVGDVREVLVQLRQALGSRQDSALRVEALRHEVEALKEANGYFGDEAMLCDDKPILPERLVRALHDVVDENTNFVLDGGNNRMWMSHFFASKRAGSFFCPGGVAAMGWSALAALGIKKAQPDNKCVAVCGDGGFAMSSHAVSSAVQLGLPIVFLVMNNAVLGNVRDTQGQRVIASEFPELDFAKLGEVYGAVGRRVDEVTDLASALEEALASDRPVVLDVIINKDQNFLKMVQWI